MDFQYEEKSYNEVHSQGAVILNLGHFITNLGNSKDLLKGREGSAALFSDGHLLLKILGGEFSYVRLPTLFTKIKPFSGISI